MYSQSLTTLALAATTALAAPTGLAPRDLVIQCGQYQQLSNGPYTLYTNGWSWSSGQGNQCSSIWSRDGSRLTWSTSWSWSGTPTQVKSYTNVETNIQKKQLSQYKSMPTYWTWDYTGTNIRANGEYLADSSYQMTWGTDFYRLSRLRHVRRQLSFRRPDLRSHGLAWFVRRHLTALVERLPIQADRQRRRR